MNSQIVFTLKDLGMFVLWGLLVAVLILYFVDFGPLLPLFQRSYGYCRR